MGKSTPLWRAIAAELRADIADGRYAPGDKLPTEAQLAARFGVNRHTVRQGLAALTEDRLVQSRRGAGVFVLARPTEYALGRRVRFRENLLAVGRVPARQIHGIETRAASAAESAVLGGAAEVCVCHGLSLSDNQPIALFESLFPSDRLPGIAAALAEESGVTDALARVGVADYARVSTRLTAIAATATQAARLRVAEGAPLLRATALNADPDGRPVEYGRAWFVGDRVTLTVESEESG